MESMESRSLIQDGVSGEATSHPDHKPSTARDTMRTYKPLCIAFVKTGQEWADIISDVYTVYGLRQMHDLRVRELSNWLAYHLASTVILNLILAVGFLITLQNQMKPAWKVLQSFVRGTCFRKLTGLMFFLLSTVNAGSTRILLEHIMAELKEEGKTAERDHASSARTIMEQWCLWPRLWEDIPQIVGQLVVIWIQLSSGQEVAWWQQLSLGLTFFNLFLSVLEELVKWALTVGDEPTPDPALQGVQNHALQDLCTIALVGDICGFLSLPARAFVMTRLQDRIFWAALALMLIFTLVLHIIFQLCFLSANRKFMQHLRSYPLVGILSQGALIFLGSYASIMQIRLYGVSDQEGAEELRRSLRTGCHWSGGASLVARVSFIVFIGYSLYLNYSEIASDEVLCLLLLPDVIQLAISSYVWVCEGEDTDADETQALGTLRRSQQVKEAFAASGANSYMCVLLFLASLCGILAAGYCGFQRPTDSIPTNLLVDGFLPSSAGAYKYVGWAEDHPLYQQVASKDPFKLFYWHSRSGKPGASFQGEWVLSKKHKAVISHNPCSDKDDCFESGKASDSNAGLLDSLRTAQWEKANVKDPVPSPTAINDWPDFSTFVLCSTANYHICGTWKQAKKQNLGWLDLFDRSQTGDSWHHARPVFEPHELFPHGPETTNLRQSQKLTLKYTKPDSGTGRWCIMKQDRPSLCKAPSDEPLPFDKSTIQANFTVLEGWQSCDSTGKCLASSDLRVGTKCDPLCQGCFGPKASHCLHCQQVNSSSGVCVSECKEGKEIEVDGVCKVTCAAITCQKDHLYIENYYYETIGKTPQKTCCVEACSAVQCHAGYTHIEEAEKTAKHSSTSCCVKACSTYTCPEQHIHKPGASTIAGQTTDKCCDKTCSAYTCPEQHIHKPGASTTAGQTTDKCCDKTCSAYTCPEQHIHKPGASTTAGQTTETCCGKIQEICSSAKTLSELPARCLQDPSSTNVRDWSLTGDLSDLSGWASLRRLDFEENNKITGDLSSLSGLTSLEYVDFRENKKITGDLSSLSGLKSLKHLGFRSNKKITGDLSSLSGLTSLKHLDFYYNEKITGALSSLSGLTSLEYVDFFYNDKITGDLSSLSGLKSLKWVSFHFSNDFSNEKITGDLSSLSGLKSLERLDFSWTHSITGDLRSLSGLKSLKYIDVEQNEKITGDLSALSGLKSLEYVAFEQNSKITGDLSSLSGLKSLELVDFKHSEKITGDLSSLSGLKSLDKFILTNNEKITGDLSSLSGLKVLDWVDFMYNEKITGDLSSLSGLTSLFLLNFAHNQKITGDLSSLSGLKSLYALDFESNKKITGDLSSLSGLKSLRRLDFEVNNKITGDLSSLSGLTSLADLDFTHNEKITGDLSSLSGLKLETLLLPHATKVTGSKDDLPKSFAASWARVELPKNIK